MDFAQGTHDLNAIKENQTGYPGESIADAAIKMLEARRHSLESLQKASAEINSLTRIIGETEPHASDVLHLVATETSDGVLAARVLADFLMDYFDRETEIHIVEGLQVHEGQRFRRLGLRNLIATIYRILGTAPADTGFRRVINPTGGFKGVVPYLTIIGMLEPQVEISYIYEKSPELLTLSGLPLGVDYDQLGDTLPALEKASNGVLEEKELRDALNWQTKPLPEHPAWAMFDVVEADGAYLYELSGLGEIALGHLREEKRTPVYLSKEAAERFDAEPPNSEARSEFTKILNEIHDPQLRESNHHTYTAGNPDKLPVYKLGRKKSRAFYHYNRKEDYVLVVEFARHVNETDYDKTPDRLKAYGSFRRWEGK